MTAPNDFEVSGMILDTDSYVITNLQAMVAEQIADLVGRVIELLVGQDRPSGCVDDRWFVGDERCIVSWKHVGNGSPSFGPMSEETALRVTVQPCILSASLSCSVSAEQLCHLTRPLLLFAILQMKK